MALSFIEITLTSKESDEVKSLYLSSFPKEERPPFEYLFQEKMKGKLTVYEIKEGETFVGLAVVANYLDLAYLFFFAIQESLRGKGYGGKAIKELISLYNKKRLYLCAEEVDVSYPDYENRKRREDFYIRNGFRNTKIAFMEVGVRYELFVLKGKEVSEMEHFSLMKDLIGEKDFAFFYPDVEI